VAAAGGRRSPRGRVGDMWWRANGRQPPRAVGRRGRVNWYMTRRVPLGPTFRRIAPRSARDDVPVLTETWSSAPCCKQILWARSRRTKRGGRARSTPTKRPSHTTPPTARLGWPPDRLRRRVLLIQATYDCVNASAIPAADGRGPAQRFMVQLGDLCLVGPARPHFSSAGPDRPRGAEAGRRLGPKPRTGIHQRRVELRRVTEPEIHS